MYGYLAPAASNNLNHHVTVQSRPSFLKTVVLKVQNRTIRQPSRFIRTACGGSIVSLNLRPFPSSSQWPASHTHLEESSDFPSKLLSILLEVSQNQPPTPNRHTLFILLLPTSFRKKESPLRRQIRSPPVVPRAACSREMS